MGSNYAEELMNRTMNRTNTTGMQALRKAIENSGHAISEEDAIDIAQIVLNAAADHLERTEPKAKRSIERYSSAASDIEHVFGD